MRSEYERIKVLGKGSYGAAILVKHKRSQKKMVMKTIAISNMSKQELADAKKEAAVLRSLDHPNIVRYIDSFTDGRKYCIVMEYANGGDLYQKVNKRKQQRQVP